MCIYFEEVRDSGQARNIYIFHRQKASNIENNGRQLRLYKALALSANFRVG